VIIVVNPPNKPFTNPGILAEPIDVLGIATIVKREFKEVRLLDMDQLQLENNINYLLKPKDIVIFVYDYQIPLHTSDTVQNIFEIIRNFLLLSIKIFQYSIDLENGGLVQTISASSFNILRESGSSKLPV
jgi:hypothetical protein